MYEKLQTDISELYTYDEVDQITSLTRGVLNQDRTVVTLPNFTESWNFDKTGNWLTYDRNGTVENRTHNAANELQGIATHDANGNMTVMPGLKAKYDAWNRLVELRDASDNLIARYEYNGLGHRIAKKTYSGGSLAETRHYFYNEEWECLEEYVNGQVDRTYVWGERGIDDMLLRERGEERLYPLTDPNGNVVAIADVNGDVKERYRYDAFGKVVFLNPDFTTKAASNFDWDYLYTSRSLDKESGMAYSRYRYYHVELGRFINRDPIEYLADDRSLYRYVANNPLIYVDPWGLKIVVSNDYCPEDKKKVEDDLKKLDKQFKKKLDDSSHTITIEPTKGGNSSEKTDPSGASDPKKGSGTKVGYDPNNRKGGVDDKGKTDRNPVIGLAHELGHAEQNADGTAPPVKYDQKPGTTPKNEENPLKRENEQRKKEGATPRTYYYPQNK